LAQAKKKNADADLIINRTWCKGCGICIAFCPKEALYMDVSGKAEKDIDKCTTCGVCEMFCPDFAIALVRGRVSKNAGSKTGVDAGQ